MDLESALSELRNDIASPDYIPHLVKRLLLDNQHRVTLTLRPDENFQAQQTQAETEQLAAIKSTLSEDEKVAIVEQAKALDERQQQQDDNNILPKVTLDDIPQESTYAIGNNKTVGQYPLHYYTAGTNGLSYQQLICPLPALSTEQLEALPWYTLCSTEVGIGKDDYIAIQQRQSQIVGSISNYYSIRNHTNDPQKLFAYTTLSAKSLNRNQRAMSDLMRETFVDVRFDEAERLQELITQARLGREQSITGSGHVLAMQIASASCNTTSRLIHQLMGLGALQTIKSLEQELINGNHKPLQVRLEQLHQQLMSSQKQWLTISEAECMDDYLSIVENSWQNTLEQAPSTSVFTPESAPYQPVSQAWIANSQVHFCAKAYPTVSMAHPDAAPLSVLGGVLRNGYLHRAVREQGGAYGGGASQDSGGGSFRFYSYRDPRMGETLTDFDRSIEWLFDQPVSEQSIEESILGIVSSLDKPGSPAGEAKHEFHAHLTGRTQEKRERYREQIINVTASDLERVARTYLTPDKASTAIVTGNHGESEANSLGLEIVRT